MTIIATMMAAMFTCNLLATQSWGNCCREICCTACKKPAHLAELKHWNVERRVLDAPCENFSNSGNVQQHLASAKSLWEQSVQAQKRWQNRRQHDTSPMFDLSNGSARACVIWGSGYLQHLHCFQGSATLRDGSSEHKIRPTACAGKLNSRRPCTTKLRRYLYACLTCSRKGFSLPCKQLDSVTDRSRRTVLTLRSHWRSLQHGTSFHTPQLNSSCKCTNRMGTAA